MEMGFSKIIAEKAVYMTRKNYGGSALDYIKTNRNTTDFDQELKIS